MAKNKVQKNKLKPRFKAGQIVWTALHGIGIPSSYEEYMVKSVRRGKVWLDNGPGNIPEGPYDATTGKCLNDWEELFGFTTKLLSEKPDGYKPKK